MKICCFLCLFLFVGINVAYFDLLDSDVQLANGKSAYSSRENVLDTRRRKSNGKSGRRRRVAKNKETVISVLEDKDDPSSLEGKQKS
uniref:Uncharacterized protein n=1 Tax=Trichobilharzia regenti TaxID=157069 RepID=A0AA85JFF3_TRIRE|nr:unnamed protein product [Trichobilharzia regenti]